MAYLSASDFLSEDRSSPLVKQSANGKYKTAAVDSEGSFALKHSKEGLLWEKSLHRPNNPSVSNDGTVTVESWCPAKSRDLSSELLVFDRQGRELLSERYDANALESGITSNGKFAWLTTANAENEDGNQLFVYDVSQGRRLLKTELLMRGVESIDVSGNVIEVTIDGLRCCYKDGELIESDDFQWAEEERELESPTPWQAARVAKSRLDRTDQLSEEQIRGTIKAIRKVDRRGSDKAWAELRRRKGELHQYLGEENQALKDYEKALSLDKGVGVKRKTKRLREKLEEAD
jgi:tetratricopeptide (TPR) repeat protein